MADDDLIQSRHEQSTADVLLWQISYRVALALLAASVAVALRTAGWIEVADVALATLGRELADWLLGLAGVAYALVALGLHRIVRVSRRASRTTATVMMLGDLLLVYGLVFVLAEPEHYVWALLVSVFTLQLTHVYFGRGPALLMQAASAASYLGLVALAERAGAGIGWSTALVTLLLFSLGAALVTLVQSHLHRRLARLQLLFERAEEGDFSLMYDVAADARPDAITRVGRAYNRMRTQLANIVETDPLSGCLNRRGFEQQFRREVARAARAEASLALVSIDLDHFKQVNDTYGHLVGDQVIAQAGELLRASARAGDIVARTGGEEFAVLMPGADSPGAQHLALRVVEAFRRWPFGTPAHPLHLTASVGVVAAIVRDDAIAETMRGHADQALYAAKRSGRNRVVSWSEGLSALRGATVGGEAAGTAPATTATVSSTRGNGATSPPSTTAG